MRLKEEHPELFEQAKAYEKPYEPSGKTFTWSESERAWRNLNGLNAWLQLNASTNFE